MSSLRRNPTRYVREMSLNNTAPIQTTPTVPANATTGSEEEDSFSFEDKAQLTSIISHDLSCEEFSKIIDIIQANQPDAIEDEESGTEFDLGQLNNTTLRMIHNYLRTLFPNLRKSATSTKKQQTKTAPPKRSSATRTQQPKKRRAPRFDGIKREPVDRNQVRDGSNESPALYHQCEAYKKLKDKICYVCGQNSRNYKITNHLKERYKEKFNRPLKMTSYTPSTICGNCRSILCAAKRTFTFTDPMIWRPSNGHRSANDDCDCYFCLADSSPLFFKAKRRENQPANSSCSLPKFSKNKSASCPAPQAKIESPSNYEANYTYEHGDFENYMPSDLESDESLDQNVLNSLGQFVNRLINQNLTHSNDQNENQERSRNDRSNSFTSSNNDEQIYQIELNLNKMRRDLESLNETVKTMNKDLNAKIGGLQNDLDFLKEQQQLNALNTLNISSLLVLTKEAIDNRQTQQNTEDLLNGTSSDTDHAMDLSNNEKSL